MVSLIRLSITFIFCIHIMACIMIFLNFFLPFENNSTTLNDPSILAGGDTVINIEFIWIVMVNSWYFCCTTVTTVGYGDLYPTSDESATKTCIILYVMSIEIFGMFLFSLTS